MDIRAATELSPCTQLGTANVRVIDTHYLCGGPTHAGVGNDYVRKLFEDHRYLAFQEVGNTFFFYPKHKKYRSLSS